MAPTRDELFLADLFWGNLSEREKEVVEWLSNGYRIKAIADIMDMTDSGVTSHINDIWKTFLNASESIGTYAWFTQSIDQLDKKRTIVRLANLARYALIPLDTTDPVLIGITDNYRHKIKYTVEASHKK